MRLTLIGRDQLLVYAGDVNLLEGNICTVKENTGALFHASKEVSLEVNTENTKYMLMSRHQNAAQKHNIKIVNGYTENVQRSSIWERQ
jgi:hypothetical protein